MWFSLRVRYLPNLYVTYFLLRSHIQSVIDSIEGWVKPQGFFLVGETSYESGIKWGRREKGKHAGVLPTGKQNHRSYHVLSSSSGSGGEFLTNSSLSLTRILQAMYHQFHAVDEVTTRIKVLGDTVWDTETTVWLQTPHVRITTVKEIAISPHTEELSLHGSLGSKPSST